MALYVKQLELGPMKNFVYLVGSHERPETAVIDPAWDIPAILEAAHADGRQLTHAFVTHRHFDHTNGIVPLLELLGLPVVIHRDDAGRLPEDVPRSELTLVTGGERFEVGGLGVTCVHTPGHTAGSQCFHLDAGDGALLSGDTVFVNACGRCDLEDSDPRQMYDSLTRVLGALDSRTILFPGHDYGDVPVSSLARERQRNPYFQFGSAEEFVGLRSRPRG